MFRAKGVTGTGILEIIAAADAPRGSMYHHFPGGKSELVEEALRFESTRVAADLQDILDTDFDVPTALRAFVEALATSLETSDFRLGCPVSTAALELAADDPKIRAVCADSYKIWHSMIETLSLRRSDNLDQDTVAVDAELVLSTIEGGLLLSRAYRDANVLRRLMDRLCRIVT